MERILKEFQTIPSVGKAVAVDLYRLGYRSLDDLRGENPDKMYSRLCEMDHKQIDKCMLYTFRCVMYFVSQKHHDPQKLQWWYWKDKV